MRILKSSVTMAVLLSAIFAYPSQNIETMKAVIKMQSKIDSLREKIARSDSTLIRLEARIAEEEYKIQEMEKRDSPCSDTAYRLHRQYGVPAIIRNDFTIGVGATMVLQGTSNPNAVSKNKMLVGDAAYSTNVFFEKKFDSAASRAFLRCEAAGGYGLDGDLQTLSRVNYDALGTQGIQAVEAWYEQSFFQKKILGTIGLIDPSAHFDGNAAANDETVQFLSQMFVANPSIEYPHTEQILSFMSFTHTDSRIYYAPGVLVQLEPVNWLAITGGIFDANRDWQRIGDNIFGMGQIAFAPSISGSQGNYRIYGWYNQMPHQDWNDSSVTGAISYGVGLSFDQQIGEMLLLFARYGTRISENYDASAFLTTVGPFSTIVENCWSAGLQINGKLWYRDNDAAGIAAGQVPFSSGFKKANSSRQSKTETHFELYYKIQCFDKMSISPDIQYILNPYGKDALQNSKNIPIVGIRSEVDF